MGESSTMPHQKKVLLFGRTPHQKKVLLFGRMGCGKSTVANALVEGDIQPVTFQSSSGASACTHEIQTGKGRGWRVVDTVGLGQAKVDSYVSCVQATDDLRRYLRNVKGVYSHIIYVMRADERLTEVEQLIWILFNAIFEGGEDAFVVLYTRGNAEWLEKEKKANRIPRYFMKYPILVVDIPPVRRISIMESRNVSVRRRSIQKLEEDLEDLFRKRNYAYAIPKIARMGEMRLGEQSKSIITKVLEKLRSLFWKENWKAVIMVFSNLINLVAFVSDVVVASTPLS